MQGRVESTRSFSMRKGLDLDLPLNIFISFDFRIALLALVSHSGIGIRLVPSWHT